MDSAPHYGETMVSPFTGLAIPKTLEGNLAWRKDLIKQANASASIRRTLKQASASDPIFWINAFAWTFLQKQVDGQGMEHAVMGQASHVPFITWKVQDEAIVDLHTAITRGSDVMIRKSRDLGASWIVLTLFQWFFQFRPASGFMEISRKENLVDRRGDMDSLFEKHRYLMQWQPEWLRPQRIKDNRLHLENLDIGTTIEGESTNESAGQAARKTAILLDEFARVPNGEEIDLATADTTACRIFLSTPQGPNTAYARIFKAMKGGSRRGTIIYMPWWRHPDKGRNAVQKPDPITGTPKWTSPWYEDQLARRSKKNVAMNLDMEDGAAGDLFFDTEDIERHRKMYATLPLAQGNVVFDEDMGEDRKLAIVRAWDYQKLQFVQSGSRRPWRFWVPLINGRPNQMTRYVLAVDISAGSGASNSVISVLDHYSNAIVAKWWDAFTSPEALADVVAFAGVFFGGMKPPLIIFEKNGPGMIFGKRLVSKLQYPAIYYQTVEDQRTKLTTSKWGWHSSPSRKEMLLGSYREALKTHAIINPCEEGLDEALEYVYDDSGRLEPGSLGEEAGGGSALHGDHVIADALLILGRQTLPKQEPEPRGDPKAPFGTFAQRRKINAAKDREKLAWAD